MVAAFVLALSIVGGGEAVGVEQERGVEIGATPAPAPAPAPIYFDQDAALPEPESHYIDQYAGRDVEHEA